MQAVCEAAGVSFSELIGRDRHAAVIEARRVIVVLLRERTRMSYPEIARALYRRNHSSFAHRYWRYREVHGKGNSDLYKLVAGRIPLHIGGEAS